MPGASWPRPSTNGVPDTRQGRKSVLQQTDPAPQKPVHCEPLATSTQYPQCSPLTPEDHEGRTEPARARRTHCSSALPESAPPLSQPGSRSGSSQPGCEEKENVHTDLCRTLTASRFLTAGPQKPPQRPPANGTGSHTGLSRERASTTECMHLHQAARDERSHRPGLGVLS